MSLHTLYTHLDEAYKDLSRGSKAQARLRMHTASRIAHGLGLEDVFSSIKNCDSNVLHPDIGIDLENVRLKVMQQLESSAA